MSDSRNTIDETDEEDTSAGGPLRAYLQLVRLPNVFTAIADVMMGFLVVRRSFDMHAELVTLIGISSLLYLAGMVWNDVFDHAIDARERPSRPIPSGRVSLGSAKLIGIVLLVGALGLAAWFSWSTNNFKPFALAGGIAALVMLYDKWLKHTLLGPWAMGGCRFLNVLLGMNIAEEPLRTLEYALAAGMGVYVVGVTLFAKREAEHSPRFALVPGILVMMAGLGIVSSAPKLVDDWRVGGLPDGWWLFWAVLAGHILWRVFAAIHNPTPNRVQAAVKNCILSIIVIDAAAGMSTSGVLIFPLIILVLIVPATFLGRWLYST